MNGFRAAYLADWPTRTVDVLLHAVLAAFLPGHWWYQFLPDVFLPYLWLRAMVRDRFDADGSVGLELHRLFHARGDSIVEPLALVLLLALASFRYPALAGAWLAHLAVDSVTHDRRWL